MPNFKQVPTEYAYGTYAGADYGSRIRVLMRSDKAVMFVGYGVNLHPRDAHSYTSTRKIANAAKRTELSTPEVRAKIIAAFGEGADEAAILAATTRGQGTVLVDGGGDRLPLPHAVQSKLTAERYAAATPTFNGEVPPKKKCRQCEDDLRPVTIRHWLSNGPKPSDDQPTTVEQCQRLSNFPVVAVHGCGSNYPEEWWPYVEWFETWDGESYHDPNFCSDRCAAVYGRRALAELPPLEPGGSAPTIERPRFDDVRHCEPRETIISESGLRL